MVNNLLRPILIYFISFVIIPPEFKNLYLNTVFSAILGVKLDQIIKLLYINF